jgi:protein-disulfide isomerase
MTNEQQSDNSRRVKKDLFLPVSIVIAAVLIGGAIVWSTLQKGSVAQKDPQANTQAEAEKAQLKLAENVVPISDSDHILGSKDAPVKVIVFTDLECPYCKEFHQTLKRGLAEYDGKIAIIFRHFPLSQIHNYAEKEAEASECVAKLGGEQSFWDFVDKVFETTKSNDGLDPALLPKLASDVGVDKAKFEKCLSSGEMAAKVSAQQKDGLNSGVQGTPHSIVIGKDGKKYIIGGAYPFENPQDPEFSFKTIIEKALADF